MSILNLKDSEILNSLARQKLKEGRAEEAVILLNRLKEKDRASLLILLECYQGLNLPFSGIQTLEKLIALKPSKFLYQALTLELKKVKKHAKALHFARQGEKNYGQDPDFKKEVLDILLEGKKFRAALQYLKKNRFFLSREKFLLSQSRIYRDTGKNLKSLWVSIRLVREHPFNILYRYLLSSAFEGLGFKKLARRHQNFIRDFVTQIPKIATGPVSASGTDFERVVNQLWEECR